MSHPIRTLILCCLPLATGAAELANLEVAPIEPIVPPGTIQHFTATGTFTDATTARLSNATLAAGGNHACVVEAVGSVRCWGRNGMGQLGNGGGADAFVPVRVGAIGTAIAVAAGHEHSCAVHAFNGTVQCWGRNDTGQLGNGMLTGSPTPVNVLGLGGATGIGAGLDFSCALLSSGGVRCWGHNDTGQLGNASTSDSSTPVAVNSISTAVQLAVGGLHTCALLVNGTVQCWGANYRGQLGIGGTSPSSVPVTVSGITTGLAIASGFDHTCVVIAGGDVMCWGRNFEGQLGTGVTSPGSSTPVAALVSNIVALAGGLGHTCALEVRGIVICWGDNGNGQLGNGTLVGIFPTPEAIGEFGGVVAIATSYHDTCALNADGRAFCWGLNDGGQLGAGSSVQRIGTPLEVSGSASIVSAGNHTCAVSPSGRPSCWGQNFYGQLGNGTRDDASTPVLITDNEVSNVTRIALGFDHTCAVTLDGIIDDVWCWGRGDSGELGSGTPAFLCLSVPCTTVPTRILSILGQTMSIAAGAHHTCVAQDAGAGQVWCWGANNRGQLGNGGTDNAFTPVQIPNVFTAVAVTAGFEHSCALRGGAFAGTVICWGRGDEGQLGNGGTADSLTPVLVSGITTATAIAAGNFHTCARLANSSIQCWGRGDEGQLGNGGTADSSIPVNTTNGTNAADIAAGGQHSCLRSSGGLVRCWGTGTSGQLGIGVFENRTTPQPVLGISTALAVEAGNAHTCAILASGALQCWGLNSFGRLGSGLGPNSAVPLIVNALSRDAVALSWLSSAKNVADIAVTGATYAAGLGATGITASYSGITDSTVLEVAPDTDGDGLADPVDNCINHPNPDQRNTDGDIYGNRCDADLNNSGGNVNFADLSLFRAVFGSANVNADFDGSGGAVNFADLSIFRALFGQPPGPSGFEQR